MNPPDGVNTPDSELDKILGTPNEMMTSWEILYLANIKTALLAWRKQSLLALIGEDDDLDEEDTDFSFAEQQARNELRDELRKAIEEPELAPDKSDVRTDDSGKDGSL